MDDWSTRITCVEPSILLISGYPLEQLVEKKGLLETAFLLVHGELPGEKTLEDMEQALCDAALLPTPSACHVWGDDLSKTLAKSILIDQNFPSKREPHTQTAFCLGRMLAYVANIWGVSLDEGSTADMLESALGGGKGSGRLMEAIAVACVDHGVTPPSAQATLIASSVRASYEVAVANGISAITDVHGGAGAKAAAFFSEVVDRKEGGIDLETALQDAISERLEAKKRIAGLGHRVHTRDPRRDVLWELAARTGVAGDHEKASRIVTEIFEKASGKNLPINVDGVIGALVADMGLDFAHAKTLFIIGRVAGLSAHHYEELTRPAMRKMDFSRCKYAGLPLRNVP